MDRKHYSLSDGDILATAYTEPYTNGWDEAVHRVVTSVTSGEGYLGSTGILRKSLYSSDPDFIIISDGGKTWYGGHRGRGDTPDETVKDYLRSEIGTFKRTIKSDSPMFRVIRFRSIPGRRGQVYR